MINAAQLKALSDFLEALTDLSLQTGVTLGGHMRPDIEVNGEFLTLDVQRDSDGAVTYSVDIRQP